MNTDSMINVLQASGPHPDQCPGYLDNPFKNKHFGHGSLALFSSLQRLIFSKALVF